MLGNIIVAGLIGAAAVAVIAIVITGLITKKKISEKISDDAIIKSVNRCTNTITLEDLDDQLYEIKGDDIDIDIKEGDWIYV